MLADLVSALRAEARRANERRLLVLTGDHEACLDAVCGLDVTDCDAVLVGHRDIGELERYPPRRADTLLGTTRECVVLDAHEECRPNALGRVVGAVDGGGLFVLLVPPLVEWPARRDRFDETLAVPPATVSDVAGNFRKRLVALVRAHDGVAIVDVDSGTVERDGLTDPKPSREQYRPSLPTDSRFPRDAYEACLTADQARTLGSLEALAVPSSALVVEADRGRGKSSAAGLAAGALAADGRDVLVTAPERDGTREVFARARELLATLDVLAVESEDGDADNENDDDSSILSTSGGSVRYEPPAIAADHSGVVDAVVVDEAAGLPVALLERFLTGTPVAFATTIHGYEGAGRGFSVRFRDRLAESDLDVTECSMKTPIRYAATDPVERWAFRTLLLDARPPVEPLVSNASVETAAYGRPTASDLLVDKHRLRELFGLLVLAHYRTEPNDLARLLDAPNLSVRTLTHEGHVVSVALLAREGGLSAEACEEAYRGGRIRGNMLPDLMTGQLRDPDAAATEGIRVMRIATHPTARSQGFGSRLLDEIHGEFGDTVDWFGVGYGATPDLLRFWQHNGYRTVHLSTTRNETSGEHSAAMVRPARQSALYDRHTRWFCERIGGMLSDSLSGLAPDVVRGALAATDARIELDLSDREWRLVASAAFGPGQFDMHPAPFRRLVLIALTDSDTNETDMNALTAREERLLVRRILQAHPWDRVAEELDYLSTRGCRRALGRALGTLVERYGTSAAAAERRRYDE